MLNYGQITNNVRVQDARLQALLIEYQNTVLKAQKEVENGLAAFLQGRKQVDLLRRSVSAANNALRIAVDQYLLGTRDFTTVLTAEQNLYQAQTNLASASGNLSTGLASVYRSLGGGWQIREGNEFVNAASAMKCATGQIGASCCRPPTNRSRRPQGFRRPPTGGRTFGHRSGELMKIASSCFVSGSRMAGGATDHRTCGRVHRDRWAFGRTDPCRRISRPLVGGPDRRRGKDRRQRGPCDCTGRTEFRCFVACTDAGSVRSGDAAIHGSATGCAGAVARKRRRRSRSCDRRSKRSATISRSPGTLQPSTR